ncbi:MAG: ice-binding family protein [Candidatus Marinimicrobia bacterium]|nr:ice-binding family protein [Candidatus Neomarinimicrobiota bacterium]
MKIPRTEQLIPARRSLRSLSVRIMGAIAVVLPLSVAIAQPLDPVNLGSTANFAILAGSLVSNVPTSAITGDIGLSPATGGNITGFGPNEVTGTIYTTDASGPAGSVQAATMLTAAQGDLTIAYNDAAGRTPVPEGPFLNPGSGDIGGMTLVAGLYKFTSGVIVSISGSDVTLSGGPDDVWIFQIASSLIVGNGVHVILSGGAQAANIFWQVGTSATLGTNSVFKGTIMADQSIAVNTGASVEGRLLASIAAVTIESSTITVPELVTTVENEPTPESFTLSQNYPNPFNPVTLINYRLPVATKVTLSIIDVLGREVSVLVNDVQNAGDYQAAWDARGFPSGIYIYRLQAGSFVSMKRMHYLK